MEEGRRAERIQYLTSEDGMLSDISITGMCLKVDKTLLTGSFLSLDLSSRQLSVTVKARAVYSKPAEAGRFYIGLQYVSLDDKQQKVVSAMVDGFARASPFTLRSPIPESMVMPRPSTPRKSGAFRVVALLAIIFALIAAGVLLSRRRLSLPVVDYTAVKNVETPAPVPNSAMSPKFAAPPSGPKRNFAVGPVVCATADTARHGLRVGLRLVYSGDALEAELRQKQENIERIIRFVFVRKQLTQIDAESARQELLEKINAFLTEGKVEDLVFTTFDILPMEMR
jgi:flagellar basal body-associated protein FliL